MSDPTYTARAALEAATADGLTADDMLIRYAKVVIDALAALPTTYQPLDANLTTVAASAPVTGVAVSAAAIHAALVTLNLITA